MTRRLPADPAPGPLEDYSARFDDLFDTLAGRATSLSPLPGRATATHRAKQDLDRSRQQHRAHGWGAAQRGAGSFQWFLSESSWSPEEINRRRGCRSSHRGGEALRAKELDRAELQAGKERFGMVASPGKEGHLHSPPLADGVLRLHLLLVGEFGSPGGRGISGGHTPS